MGDTHSGAQPVLLLSISFSDGRRGECPHLRSCADAEHGAGKIVAQLLSFPICRLWARFIPSVKVFGVSLNTGPFTVKEHVLITVMATVGYQSAYAVCFRRFLGRSHPKSHVEQTDIIAVQRVYYNQIYSFSYQWMVVMSTQLVSSLIVCSSSRAHRCVDWFFDRRHCSPLSRFAAFYDLAGQSRDLRSLQHAPFAELQWHWKPRGHVEGTLLPLCLHRKLLLVLFSRVPFPRCVASLFIILCTISIDACVIFRFSSTLVLQLGVLDSSKQRRGQSDVRLLFRTRNVPRHIRLESNRLYRVAACDPLVGRSQCCCWFRVFLL